MWPVLDRRNYFFVLSLRLVEENDRPNDADNTNANQGEAHHVLEIRISLVRAVDSISINVAVVF